MLLIKRDMGFLRAPRTLFSKPWRWRLSEGASEIREAKHPLSEKCAKPTDHVQIIISGYSREVPLFDRSDMIAGQRVLGPAIIKEATGTNIVEPGWCVFINEYDHLILSRQTKLERKEAVGTKADPVMLEVFNNLFMSIAEQMGATLANTAYSVNIKERLDFSCALFDEQVAWWPMHPMCRYILEVCQNQSGQLSGATPIWPQATCLC